MKIFPAIDIIKGKAVRLFQGDYEEMTVYDDNPVFVARRFYEAGARYLHVASKIGRASCRERV